MIKTVINPEFEHLRKELSSIPETIAVCGTKIFQGRNRIYRATIGGIDLTVKEFRVPSLANRIAYTFFRKGKARRSYDNAMTLGKLGIGTPEPIAPAVCSAAATTCAATGKETLLADGNTK